MTASRLRRAQPIEAPPAGSRSDISSARIRAAGAAPLRRRRANAMGSVGAARARARPPRAPRQAPGRCAMSPQGPPSAPRSRCRAFASHRRTPESAHRRASAKGPHHHHGRHPAHRPAALVRRRPVAGRAGTGDLLARHQGRRRLQHKDGAFRLAGGRVRRPRRLLGGVHHESYALVHEVPASAYGFGGQTQEFRFIAGRMKGRQ